MAHAVDVAGHRVQMRTASPPVYTQAARRPRPRIKVFDDLSIVVGVDADEA